MSWLRPTARLPSSRSLRAAASGGRRRPRSGGTATARRATSSCATRWPRGSPRASSPTRRGHASTATHSASAGTRRAARIGRRRRAREELFKTQFDWRLERAGRTDAAHVACPVMDRIDPDAGLYVPYGTRTVLSSFGTATTVSSRPHEVTIGVGYCTQTTVLYIQDMHMVCMDRESDCYHGFALDRSRRLASIAYRRTYQPATSDFMRLVGEGSVCVGPAGARRRGASSGARAAADASF